MEVGEPIPTVWPVRPGAESLTLEEPETRKKPLSDWGEDALVLGIETSCDETSTAVVKGGRQILSNIIVSQGELHGEYGGIVPELAARQHVEALTPAIREALFRADVTFWDLDGVAATMGPGLIGSLLVGVAEGKSIAAVLDLPFVGVNHLEAHVYSNLLAHKDAEFPAVSLIISGGHTLLVHARGHGDYEILGTTIDDAAGEAFDKVARFLGLDYPGGRRSIAYRFSAIPRPSRSLVRCSTSRASTFPIPD